MTTDREATRIVRSWLQTDEHESAEGLLGTVLDRLDATPQRRPMWRAWRTYFMNGTFRFAAAAMALAIVAGIGLALYFSRPTGPAATPSPIATPSATQPAVVSPTDSQSGPLTTQHPLSTPAARAKDRFVLFLRRLNGDGLGDAVDLWALRADGTGAQEIFPDLGYPSVAWSQDGKHVLAASQVGPPDSTAVPKHQIFLADVSEDAIGPFVDTGLTTGGETACNDKSRKPAPCEDSAFAFAPDGERIAFVEFCTYTVPGCTFLTTMDLRTGERTELNATFDAERPPELPAWSPDGSQIAFTRELASGIRNLYVIGADGRNLRQVEVGGLSVGAAPQWSPDGNEIVFGSSSGIYVVQFDGTGLRQVTGGGTSCCPEWTPSNMILVQRMSRTMNSLAFAVIDPNDGHVVTEYPRVNLDLAIAAIEPPGYRVALSVSGDPGRGFLWQPTR